MSDAGITWDCGHRHHADCREVDARGCHEDRCADCRTWDCCEHCGYGGAA